jgi:hypothetical protein
MPDDPLASAPRVPPDTGAFTPELYPDAPPLVPASGHRHADASIGDVMVQLVGTAGEAVFGAWTEGRTAVTQLRYGAPSAPGRVVGPDAAGVRVVNDRYRAEDARLLLPSIVHALLWSGPGAGHAEETVLHALGAYVHAALLARDPLLATTGTELARRQNSVTITLLNSRRPGASTITLVAPDGPGTVPGGAPGMQTPDFWSVPFGPVAADGAPIAPVAFEVLGALAPRGGPDTPTVWTDAVGAWCSSAFASLLDHDQQLAANRALGLL